MGAKNYEHRLKLFFFVIEENLADILGHMVVTPQIVSPIHTWKQNVVFIRSRIKSYTE